MSNEATRVIGGVGPQAEVASSRLRADAKADPIKTLQSLCQEVAKAAPGDVQQIASLHNSMILSYYQDVRRQAQQSFIAALVLASIATMFYLYAILWPMAHAEGVA